MFSTILAKEWRDNRLLLSLMGAVLVALIILGLAGQDRVTVAAAGILLIFALPITALLLGAGAFGAEYRDNAWSYLFSRPVRKSTIWLSKYLALLSFLAAAFLLLTLAVALLPGLKAVLADFYEPSFLGRTLLFGLLIWLIFTVAYSLSILSEKSLIVLAVSVLVLGLMAWLHLRSVRFFDERYGTWGYITWFGLLVGTSFAAASILTLTRVDFTRKARKAATFAGLLLAFLTVSVVAEVLIVSKGRPFAKPRIAPWYSTKVSNSAYLGTYSGRYLTFDASRDLVTKLPADINVDFDLELSSGGGRIGYVAILGRRTRAARAEARVAGLDGAGATTLARFYGAESALNGWIPESNVLISSEGRQAAFVASPPGRDRARDPARLFWMNVNGTGVQSKPLDFLGKGSVKLLSWPEGRRDIVLRLAEKSLHSVRIRIIRFNLDAGVGLTLDTTLPYPANYEWFPASSLSPTGRHLIVRVWDEVQNKQKTVILDLETFETREISTEMPFYGWAWSSDGGRIAFYNHRSQGLWVWSIPDGSLKKAWDQPNKRIALSFDWLADGRLLVAGKEKESGDTLVLLKDDLSPDKRIKLPENILNKIAALPSYYVFDLVGLNGKALIVSETAVWRLDLATETWKRVY